MQKQKQLGIIGDRDSNDYVEEDTQLSSIRLER